MTTLDPPVDLEVAENEESLNFFKAQPQGHVVSEEDFTEVRGTNSRKLLSILTCKC